MLKAADDKEGAKLAMGRVKQKTAAYNEYCRKNGFKRKPDRLTVQGYRSRVKNQLDNLAEGGIIEVGSDSVLKVKTGGLRNETPLTDKQIKEITDYAVSMGMPRDRIYYVDYDCTGYGAAFDLLRIGTDVLPASVRQKNPNGNVSMHGAIAHELIGHRNAALAGRTHQDETLEEVQASIRAARFAKDLTLSERITLYRDALKRLRDKGYRLRAVKGSLYIDKE